MKLVAASTRKCFEMLTPLPDAHTSISTNDCNYIESSASQLLSATNCCNLLKALIVEFRKRGVNDFLENVGTCSCIFRNKW